MRIALPYVLLCFLLPACKTSRSNDHQNSDPSFLNLKLLFKGNFQRFSESYDFTESQYNHLFTHKYGTVQELGTFDWNERAKTIQWTPKEFVCLQDGASKRVSVQDFKPIFESQKELLIKSFQTNLTDPAGLKNLLIQYKDAQAKNEQTALSQEIAAEIGQNNVTQMKTFLDFITEMGNDIKKMDQTVTEKQEAVGKKQDEINLVEQEKLNNRDQIATLNVKRDALVQERNILTGEINALVSTMGSYHRKIALLLQENPIDEADLVKALADVKGIEDFKQYTKERQTYLESNVSFIQTLIKDNEGIIANLKTYEFPYDHTYTQFFKITDLQLFLDSKPVSASSEVFEKVSVPQKPKLIADCKQAALIILTRYLEDLQGLPPYQEELENAKAK